MIQIKLDLDKRNLDKIAKKVPRELDKQIKLAVKKAVLILQSNAEDRVFQFKTPRESRTGELRRSIKVGSLIRGLTGAVFPLASIAPYAEEVHRNNPYLPRIAKVSTSKINSEFNKSIARALKIGVR